MSTDMQGDQTWKDPKKKEGEELRADLSCRQKGAGPDREEEEFGNFSLLLGFVNEFCWFDSLRRDLLF